MKKIQYILTILCLLIIFPCCENDGGNSKISTENGALPNIQKLKNTDAFIDILSIQSGGDFNLGFSVDLAIGKITSMDIVAFYTKVDGTLTKATIATNIVSLPATFTLNKDDLFDAFNNLNTADDISTGDKLTISAEITLKDGTVLKVINDNGTNNFSSNIATSDLYKVFQTYNVACASYLAGTYNYSTTNIGSPDSDFIDDIVTGTVTFTDKEGGVYDISDASFGGWGALYGETAAKGVQLIDVCNQISFGGEDKYGETYSITNIVVNGNVLSFHWENSYKEYGDTTLTRTDNTDWPDLKL